MGRIRAVCAEAVYGQHQDLHPRWPGGNDRPEGFCGGINYNSIERGNTR